jgi:glucose-6-phosphate isomerase
MGQIKLNYANCLTEFVGDEGISVNELDSLQSRIKTIYRNLKQAREAGNLGFMELPYRDDEVRGINSLARRLKSEFDNFIVVGIGGSALGNIALQTSLKPLYWNSLGRKNRKGWLKLYVPDNVDPELISSLLETVNLNRTLINIISKSGTTSECLSNFFIIRDKLIKKVGKKKYNKHIIVSTDSKKGYLRELAVRDKFASFVIPENVGGRFSVLSPVGLVSAAFTGVDIGKLLLGARDMDKRCDTDEILKNPAALYAILQYLFYRKGKRISVMMPYSNALYGMADWFRQLWAESLGKESNRKDELVNVGPTPLKALGVTDQHSQVQLYMEGPYDKIITFLSVDKFRKTVKIPQISDKHYLGGHTLNELLKFEEEATRLALTQNRRPNCTIVLPEIDEYTIGQLIYLLELATAYAGELFDINTFNQPGVELGKQLTYALLDRPGYESKKKELAQQLVSSDKSKYIV